MRQLLAFGATSFVKNSDWAVDGGLGARFAQGRGQ